MKLPVNKIFVFLISAILAILPKLVFAEKFPLIIAHAGSYEFIRGIEKDTEKPIEPTDEELDILEAYNKLPEDDWRRKAVEKILLKEDTEVDNNNESHNEK